MERAASLSVNMNVRSHARRQTCGLAYAITPSRCRHAEYVRCAVLVMQFRARRVLRRAACIVRRWLGWPWLCWCARKCAPSDDLTMPLPTIGERDAPSISRGGWGRDCFSALSFNSHTECTRSCSIVDDTATRVAGTSRTSSTMTRTPRALTRAAMHIPLHTYPAATSSRVSPEETPPRAAPSRPFLCLSLPSRALGARRSIGSRRKLSRPGRAALRAFQQTRAPGAPDPRADVMW